MALEELRLVQRHQQSWKENRDFRLAGVRGCGARLRARRINSAALHRDPGDVHHLLRLRAERSTAPDPGTPHSSADSSAADSADPTAHYGSANASAHPSTDSTAHAVSGRDMRSAA